MQVGHIKRLQHGIRDIQIGKMPRRLLHPTCGVMSQNYDLSEPSTSRENTTPRMSNSSAFSSSFQGATITAPPCDLPRIQISDIEMEDSSIGMGTEEELFDQETHVRHRNCP